MIRLPRNLGEKNQGLGTMRVFAFSLLVLSILHVACARRHGASRAVPHAPVEFIGVYEERADIVPSLRSARTIVDMQRLLLEARRPGHGLVRAQFKVTRVLSAGGHRLKRGHQIALIFRSPKDPHDPSSLPETLIGKEFRIVLYDRFDRRYCGRFSCSQWHEKNAPPSTQRAPHRNELLASTR